MKNNRLERLLAGLLVLVVIALCAWIYKALVYIEEHPQEKQNVSPRLIIAEVQNVE